MSLNIKNPEAQALATELARLRNVSLTQAVLDAVREELAREKRLRRHSSLAEELVAIGTRCAAHLKPGLSSKEAVDELYDEQGLPR
jgi:antitoxin VapB